MVGSTKADAVDMESPTETFEFLCKLSGVPVERGETMDFDGFVLAFEQLFNNGIQLDPDAVDELMAAVGSTDFEDVTMADWAKFHKEWRSESTASAHLEAKLERKRAATALEEEKQRAADQWQEMEKQYQEKLANVKAEQQSARPQLLSEMTASKYGDAGGAAQAAAAHRTLDPNAWSAVVDGVGGLDAPLESIRRRVWVPLCAPPTLLEELGAERVKGLLLYGPPGCGKSLLAARLASGLSRRPPTLVSGPEIMDKYVGNSEAQLRTLFTSPPRVPARPGDAEDVMVAAEMSELHVVVLDEFDSIARKRSDAADGGNAEGSAARDSVVNQLLALMDGVAGLPVPTFVIALTNRRELVDSAILRPGRLEVHVEIGKPDATGRAAILRIHAERMRESGRLSLGAGAASGAEAAEEGEEGCSLEVVDPTAYEEWIRELAEECESFSGAAIAAVVRAAVSRALDRSVSESNPQGCRVTATDFSSALGDVRRSSLELERIDAAESAGAAAPEETPPPQQQQQQQQPLAG